MIDLNIEVLIEPVENLRVAVAMTYYITLVNEVKYICSSLATLSVQSTIISFGFKDSSYLLSRRRIVK